MTVFTSTSERNAKLEAMVDHVFITACDADEIKFHEWHDRYEALPMASKLQLLGFYLQNHNAYVPYGMVA